MSVKVVSQADYAWVKYFLKTFLVWVEFYSFGRFLSRGASSLERSRGGKFNNEKVCYALNFQLLC